MAAASIILKPSPSFLHNNFQKNNFQSNIFSVSTKSIYLQKNIIRRNIVKATAAGEVAADQTPFTMFFQAEGTMNEAAIPTVTKALKATEGISNLNVQLVEGIASVELTKEITQATRAASDLVEIILGLGFTLQTLNLSFEEEEAVNYDAL